MRNAAASPRRPRRLTNQTLCSTCGRSIADDGLGGLCASCMIQLAVQDEGFDSPQPPVIPPLQHSTTPEVHEERHPLLRIPGYEVHEEIARGGMGIVYRAQQSEPQRTVALKMLLPHQVASPGMLERFRLETRAIAALEHPAILPVHHVGEHNGLPYFTMKLATGGTLAQRKGRFTGDWRRIAELLARLADAVQFAHERGVLHRDLKPGNVLFDEAGRAYVSDFGLAKLVGADSDLTRSVELLGTPHYVAPEIAARSAKEATTASDVYSLGAILYELLAGRPPFEAEGVPALLKKIAEEEPNPPSAVARGVSRRLVSATREAGESSATEEVSRSFTAAAKESGRMPRDLQVICLKCLAKEPARRYSTARELAEDLRRWLEGRTILARPATRFERVRSWVRRNPALALVSAALMLVLGIAVVLQAQANRRLQQALAESLLRQAQLERSSGGAGQRFETLALVSQAAEQLRSWWTGMPHSNIVALRTEAAAALALPDVRPLARWPAHFSHYENAFDFSGDLQRYVTAAPDGGFSVFSTADHKPLHHVAGETNNPAVHLRLSPDGSWTAVRFQDGHAELHSLAGHWSSRRWPGDSRVGAVFTFARARFAVVGHTPGRPRVVEIIDLESGATLGQLPGGEVGHLALNGAATHLAMAGAELTVWRLKDTNRLWTTPLTHYAAAIDWSPDEQYLAVSIKREAPTGASTLESSPVLLFHAATGRQKSVLAEFGSTAARLEFSADSQSLFAATWSDQLLWVSMRPKEFRLTVPGAHRALRLSEGGGKLGYAPSSEELGLLEVVTPAVWHEWKMTSSPAPLCFTIDISRDGRWVATSALDGIHLWDAEDRVEVAFFPVSVKPWWMPMFFGPGDSFLYYSSANFGVRRVELVRTNAPDGRTRMQFGSDQPLGVPHDWLALGLAADGRSVIVAEHRRHSQNERFPPTVWLWSEGNPAVARKLAEGFPLVGYRPVAGGPWAVTTDRVTPDVWIWNFEMGERVRSLGIPAQVNSEPMRNGRWLATRTRQEFAVWETGTWRAISRWSARPDEQDNGSIISSNDSQLLATDTADGAFVLRALPHGTELVRLIPPRSLAAREWIFTPDSDRLIVLCKDGQVVEWSLAGLRRELALRGLDWRTERR